MVIPSRSKVIPDAVDHFLGSLLDAVKASDILQTKVTRV